MPLAQYSKKYVFRKKMLRPSLTEIFHDPYCIQIPQAIGNTGPKFEKRVFDANTNFDLNNYSLCVVQSGFVIERHLTPQKRDIAFDVYGPGSLIGYERLYLGFTESLTNRFLSATPKATVFVLDKNNPSVFPDYLDINLGTEFTQAARQQQQRFEICNARRRTEVLKRIQKAAYIYLELAARYGALDPGYPEISEQESFQADLIAKNYNWHARQHRNNETVLVLNDGFLGALMGIPAYTFSDLHRELTDKGVLSKELSRAKKSLPSILDLEQALEISGLTNPELQTMCEYSRIHFKVEETPDIENI